MDATTENLQGYAAVLLGQLLGEAAEEITLFRQGLLEIASVTTPLDKLEINHRYAVECARETLAASIDKST